jgi:two-component system sensor histidine kinase KdpD
VFTTLNIQHLESLKDVVEGITGIKVGETVPDTIVDSADEIEVVDISPARLRQRLEEGHIYPAAQAQQAMKQFFREGNLGALRELVLQRAALEVKQQLRTYMQEHELSEWETGESVLVLVDGSPESERAIRRAWRLAHALGGELTAAIAPKGVAEEEVNRLMTLAKDLNAKIRRLSSQDNLADALSMTVTSENISHVVLAQPPRRRWPRLRPTMPELLLDRHPNLSVHLVSTDTRSETRAQDS